LADVENWKLRYTQKEREIADLKASMETQRRSFVDREIRELTAKFMKDKAELENENRRLRGDFDAL